MIDCPVIKQRLSPIAELMEGANEIDINGPGDVWVLRGTDFAHYHTPAATVSWMRSLANIVGTDKKASLSEEYPILSGQLPTGERAQFFGYPAVARDSMAMSLRIPSKTVFPFSSYKQNADSIELFTGADHVKTTVKDCQSIVSESGGHTALEYAVKAGLTIVISGETGSGKTALLNSLIDVIPENERVISVEDNDELQINHLNSLKVFYNRGGISKMRVGPLDLMESILRMNPGHLVFAESIGAEAYAFLRAARTGHPGLTTVHADTPLDAMDNLAWMASQAVPGMDRADVDQYIRRAVDMIIQLKPTGGCPIFESVYFPGVQS